MSTSSEYNPFDPANFATGGGLWDGKLVTITRISAKSVALTYKDGKPVVDAKTGKQSIQTGLFVSGIAEGEDKEREQPYGCGDRLTPGADGDSFVSKDGGPVKFHANSGVGKLVAALIASGFDVKTLYPEGRQKWSNLVGAKLLFKADPKIGKDGKPIKDKKGYDKQDFYPVQFKGYVAGGAAKAAGSNGAASGNVIDTKAEGAVLLALANGPLTRKDLVRTLSTQLKDDPDANAIVGRVINDAFHVGKPWKYENSTLSL